MASSHVLLLSLFTALVLDAIIGDPESKYHPVRLIGWIIRRGESALYRPSVPKRAGGIVLALGTVGIVLALGAGAGAALARVSPAAGIAWNILVIYFCLAFRSLIDAGERVRKDLLRHDLPAAQRHLSWIVSRDTDALAEPDIVRGTIESLSENLNDAVIAPLFYAFLFGMPGILFYKSVNTLDSMVGYKNDRYRAFGWFSARLDDVVNFVPARIALVFTLAGAFLLRYDAIGAWRTARRYGRAGESPNGGLGITAFAGALGVMLGGTNFFAGAPAETPLVLPDGRAAAPSLRDIRRAERLIAVATLLGFLAGALILAAW